MWGQEIVVQSVDTSYNPLEDIHSYTVYDRNGNNEIIDVSMAMLGEFPNYYKDYILDSSVNVAGDRSDLSAMYTNVGVY